MFIVIFQPIRALDSGHLTNQEKGICVNTFKGVGWFSFASTLMKHLCWRGTKKINTQAQIMPNYEVKHLFYEYLIKNFVQILWYFKCQLLAIRSSWMKLKSVIVCLKFLVEKKRNWTTSSTIVSYIVSPGNCSIAKGSC